jgi:hypothetical protein
MRNDAASPGHAIGWGAVLAASRVMPGETSHDSVEVAADLASERRLALDSRPSMTCHGEVPVVPRDGRGPTRGARLHIGSCHRPETPLCPWQPDIDLGNME